MMMEQPNNDGPTLQERLERSRRHKKWLTDQTGSLVSTSEITMSPPSTGKSGQGLVQESRIQHIIQANTERRKSAPAATTPNAASSKSSSDAMSGRPHRSGSGSSSTTNNVQQRWGGPESAGSSKNNSHAVVAMPVIPPPRYSPASRQKNTTQQWKQEHVVSTPRCLSIPTLAQHAGKKVEQDKQESSKVATTKRNSTAAASQPQSVSATFLHWQEREKRDLGERAASGLSSLNRSTSPWHQKQQQQQQQRKPAKHAKFAQHFSQQFVVKTNDNTKQALHHDDEDEQRSYSSQSFSSTSRSSVTCSDSLSSKSAVQFASSGHFNPTYPFQQLRQRQQPCDLSNTRAPHLQWSLPYSNGSGGTTAIRASLTPQKLHQPAPAINSDGTTNFKQLLKPINRDRDGSDAKDDGCHQQLAYGAVIETPKKANVSDLRASFDSQGSHEPIMPMNCTDVRIRHSLPYVQSFRKQDHKLDGTDGYQSRSIDTVPVGEFRTDQNLSTEMQPGSWKPTVSQPTSEDIASEWPYGKSELVQGVTRSSSLENDGCSDEGMKVVEDLKTSFHETVASTVNRTTPVHLTQNFDSVSTNQNDEVSERQSVVTSWQESIQDTTGKPSNNQLPNLERKYEENDEREHELTESSDQTSRIDDAQSHLPIEKLNATSPSSSTIKPWEADTKKSVVQSWEARKSKDRLSRNVGEGDAHASFESSDQLLQQSDMAQEELTAQNSSSVNTASVPESRDSTPFGIEKLHAVEGHLADCISLGCATTSFDAQPSLNAFVEDKIGDVSIAEDMILDDAIVSHLTLARVQMNKDDGVDYDGVEEDSYLSASHCGEAKSGSVSETTHAKTIQSHADVEHAESEELSIYTTDERTTPPGCYHHTLVVESSESNPIQKAEGSITLSDPINATSTSTIKVNAALSSVGVIGARFPRLIPSPKDSDKYRILYFGEEALTPRIGSIGQKNINATEPYVPAGSMVAYGQNFDPFSVSVSASVSKEEQHGRAAFNKWVTEDPYLTFADDENTSIFTEEVLHLQDPKEPTPPPGKKAKEAKQNKIPLPKTQTVAETRQDVFNPFEDLSESVSGLFSPEHDPFDARQGLGWPTMKPAAAHAAAKINNHLSDSNTRMEI